MRGNDGTFRCDVTTSAKNCTVEGAGGGAIEGGGGGAVDGGGGVGRLGGGDITSEAEAAGTVLPCISPSSLINLPLDTALFAVGWKTNGMALGLKVNCFPLLPGEVHSGSLLCTCRSGLNAWYLWLGGENENACAAASTQLMLIGSALC